MHSAWISVIRSSLSFNIQSMTEDKKYVKKEKKGRGVTKSVKPEVGPSINYLDVK